MVKKLLKLKIRHYIFTLFFLGAISSYANTAATTNSSFSLLKTKAVVKGVNNTANIYGENITFSGNVSFVNYLWADTSTAEAGFKKVFQKLEVVLLKGEVVAAPTVVTNPVTIFSGTTATLTGEITDLGSPVIVEYGFYWSTTVNPASSGVKISASLPAAIGTFSTDISGLNECTTYYVQAYANNGSDPIVYGLEKSFTTLDVTPPTASNP
ncbi:MAG TPA: hypothetical protein DER05_09920, partial [Lutibacter sp.]|nr:hypothetical protein [Lutibacter sp.]